MSRPVEETFEYPTPVQVGSSEKKNPQPTPYSPEQHFKIQQSRKAGTYKTKGEKRSKRCSNTIPITESFTGP